LSGVEERSCMGRPSWEQEYVDFFHANALRLRRVAWGVCGDWTEAEDIVQTAFVRIYPKFGRLRSEDPVAYARRTVVNLCLNRHRQRGREVLTGAVPDRLAADDAGGMTHVDIASAVRTLPAQQRAVVALRFLDDLSVREVATVLGISEGTVKSHTSRGIEALRKAMTADPRIEESR